MALVRPTLDASLTKGTKRQKIFLLRYWGMYFSAFGFDIGKFGTNSQGRESEVREAIQKEFIILADFTSFVLSYPVSSVQSRNSTAHERSWSRYRILRAHARDTSWQGTLS